MDEQDWRSSDDVVGELVVDIVNEIAAFEDRPSTDIRPPLGTVIDTEALGNLFATSEAPLRVTFEYLGYEVTVIADGEGPEVFVRER